MSRQTARLALERLVGRPALVQLSYAGTPGSVDATATGMLSDLRELAASDLGEETARWQQRRAELVAAYGYDEDDTEKPFAFANGRAIIPIHGVLLNRLAYSWSFVTGYNFIRSQVLAAEADPDVDGIIFDVNSRGGMVDGCQETAAVITAAGKPSIAVVDSSCFSAAYMLACCADRVVVTPSGMAGSIGVVLMHMDVSKMLDEAGVKVSFIFAGSHKVDLNPFEPLSDEVRAEWQANINAVYDDFVAVVVAGRNLTDEQVRATEARCYSAADALVVGLVDAVQAPDEAVEAFFNDDDDDESAEELDPDDDDLDPDDPERNNAMATAPAQKPLIDQTALDAERAVRAADAADTVKAEAAATARSSERARISGIQQHAEAAGRAALASHLALNTELSVEAAAGILAASPKEAPAAAGSNSHFKTAMDASKHPDAGAGGGAGAEVTEGAGQTTAQRILANQARVTGARPPARANQ